MNKGIGELFQEQTKYFRGKLPHSPLFWQSRPDLYKNYPEAVRIDLPAPLKDDGLPLWEAIHRRRSIRDFKSRSLETASLSQLLWASQGITSEYMGYKLRAAPLLEHFIQSRPTPLSIGLKALNPEFTITLSSTTSSSSLKLVIFAIL